MKNSMYFRTHKQAIMSTSAACITPTQSNYFHCSTLGNCIFYFFKPCLYRFQNVFPSWGREGSSQRSLFKKCHTFTIPFFNVFLFYDTREQFSISHLATNSNPPNSNYTIHTQHHLLHFFAKQTPHFPIHPGYPPANSIRTNSIVQFIFSKTQPSIHSIIHAI